MANAIPSRPGIDQTAGKLEINIAKNVKVVTNAAGRTVRRTEFDTGTVRETNVFPGDHKKAAPVAESKGEK